jgi:Protein of unknown function (DUF3179)
MRRLAPWAVLIVLAAVSSSYADALRTDFTKSLVPVDEIVAGGPPPDGIPAIDRPVFVRPAVADSWLTRNEPVLALEIAGDARAYPLQILMWHEIVNDTVGGRPVAITFCPLCNSGLVFDRVVDRLTLDFGTSGKLYQSDLVMYDRQTHSLWAQIEGRAIVGERAGTRLRRVPAHTIAYGDWKAIYPRGKVLSRDTGHARSYGRNPYVSYDQPDSTPFLLGGAPDPRLPPQARVVGVVLGGAERAYPWPALERDRVIHDTLSGQPLVVFHRQGALSALDNARMDESKAVGATAVFIPVAAGRALHFDAVREGVRDRQTGTVWNLLGHAVRGPLAGTRLDPIPHVDAFWFAWAAFHPSTSIHNLP